MKKLVKRSMLVASSIALLAGCTASPGEDPNAANPNNPPVANSPDNELFIFTVWPAFYVNSEVFDRQVTQFVKQKFPDIQIKHVAWDDGRRYEDLVASGTIPDIIMDNARMNLQRYIFKYDLQYDMTELIKKHNFDTSVLNEAAFAQMKNVTPDGAIYGLPFQISDMVMFYNKDVFDRFGVDYPTDGMTYDQVYEIAKQLTRVDGDITYKGYSHNPGLYMNYNQLSLSPLHPTEDRAQLNTDQWKKLVDNLRRFYEIPANSFDSIEKFVNGNIAMAVGTTDKIVSWYEQNPNLNFDIVSIPSFPEAPNTSAQPNLYSMYITKQSNKKDMAFQVVQYLLSEEYQLELAKEGIVGPLKSEAVQAAFGQNLPQMQGKNTGALFASKNAMPPAARAEGLIYVDVPMHNVFDPHIFLESKDTVTALRLTEEAATKDIMNKKALGE